MIPYIPEISASPRSYVGTVYVGTVALAVRRAKLDFQSGATAREITRHSEAVVVLFEGLSSRVRARLLPRSLEPTQMRQRAASVPAHRD